MKKYLTEVADGNTIPKQASKQARIGWIDSLKGLGIILVVIGHVTQGYIGNTTFQSSEWFLEVIHCIIYSFHMYLFFIISGMTFSIAYFRDGILNKGKLVCQIKNVIYVFSIFSIVQWIIKYAFSRFVNSEYGFLDLVLFAIKPMSPYWYLWVLAIYYLLFLLCEKKRLNKNYVILSCLVISLVSSFIRTSFSETPKDLLFFVFPFILGCFYLKSLSWLNRKEIFVLTCLISILICGYLVVNPTEIEDLPLVSVTSGTINSLGLICIFNRSQHFRINALLQLLGRYSLEIYVLHCFISAPMRKILIIVGINNIVLSVCISAIIAIVVPILIAMFLKKMNIYRLVFRPFELKQQ